MNTNIKNTIAGVVIAGAGFIGGAAGSIDASETKVFDASQAQSVNDVRITRTVVAPATTQESFTLNDLTSEIEMLNQQITSLTARRDALAAKKQSVLAEATKKFDAEQVKRDAKLSEETNKEKNVQ